MECKSKTIDVTPTWEGVLPILIETANSPSSRIELKRMAKQADKFNKYLKDEVIQMDEAVAAIETLLRLLESPVLAMLPQNQKVLNEIKNEIKKYRDQRLAEEQGEG